MSRIVVRLPRLPVEILLVEGERVFERAGDDRASDRSGPGRCREATGSWSRASTGESPTRPAGRARGCGRSGFARRGSGRLRWRRLCWRWDASGFLDDGGRIGRRREVAAAWWGSGRGPAEPTSAQSERQRGMAQPGALQTHPSAITRPPQTAAQFAMRLRHARLVERRREAGISHQRRQVGLRRERRQGLLVRRQRSPRRLTAG